MGNDQKSQQDKNGNQRNPQQGGMHSPGRGDSQQQDKRTQGPQSDQQRRDQGINNPTERK